MDGCAGRGGGDGRMRAGDERVAQFRLNQAGGLVRGVRQNFVHLCETG